MHINEYKIFLSDSPQVTKIEIICRNTYIGRCNLISMGNYLSDKVFNFISSPVFCEVEIVLSIDDETILMNDQDWEKLTHCSKIEIIYTDTRRNLIILDVKLDNQFPAGVVGISEKNSDLIGQKIAEITNINRPIREYRLAKYNLKKSVIPLYLLYFLSTFKEDELSVSEIKMNLETACDCEDNCFIQDYLQIASTYELTLEKLQMSGLIRIDGDQIELVNPSENLTENLKNEIGPIIGCI